MASGLFTVLDDIAALMDDVAIMGKVAGKKTAGLIGDDLAVNAEKASGFVSAREIPVLWAITKGSFLNKAIILPAAFLLNAFFPTIITAILLLGGFYLAYEGAEKVYGFFFPHAHQTEKPALEKLSREEVLQREEKKIKSAIVTDFILSVEIVIIALSSVADSVLATQIIVVSLIALVATVGVYGIVALIVRMDEFGARLININEQDDTLSDKTGRFLIWALPKIIKSLSFIGTVALLLVSGGIFTHNIHFLHGLLEFAPAIVVDMLLGLLIGFLLIPLVALGKKLWGLMAAKSE